MKHLLNIFVVLSFAFSIKNNSNYRLENKTSPLQKTDTISKLWNVLVFEKGGCLGGEQYVKNNGKKLPNLVFNNKEWITFSSYKKGQLTNFLVKQLADTTKTKVHTCPFFNATNGEMAIYALQQIHNKNWYDIDEFIEYKSKVSKNAQEQKQIWLQNILKTDANRKKLAEYFLNSD